MKRSIQVLLLPILVWACVTAGMATAQGIETKAGAVVLFGTPSSSTNPATIDFKKVRKKTPEWKTIRTEGVSKGSARYSLLESDMKKRIKRICEKVAKDKGNDCVVKKRDIADKRGLSPEDLTRSVIAALESENSEA